MPPDSLETNDRRLLVDALARVADKSRSALEEVYSRTSAKLFGLCLRILGDEGEAEDALQDAYIKVWRNAGSFDPARSSPITWLAAIARNGAIDRLRSQGKSRSTQPIEAADDVADAGADAFAAASANQEHRRLTGCIAELEARQAWAIRTAFFDGLSYSELAAQSNVPLGTMKSWVRRGLLRLKECLGR
jgi:RNA polymerase sigma-70 factor (ECF subfamily)